VNSGRNDLLIEGLKISGNAEHIYKNRVLHHGTLLNDSNLRQLGQAIHGDPGKYRGKAVQSRRSPVANISDFLSRALTTEELIRHLAGFFKRLYPDMTDYNIPESEIEKIRLLCEQKFSRKEWIFGYSPAYYFYNSFYPGKKNLTVELSVERGIIKTARLSGSFYSVKEIKQLEALLIGKFHLYETIDSVYQLLGLQADNDLIYSYF
jgi:lipoate-protein ligase A